MRLLPKDFWRSERASQVISYIVVVFMGIVSLASALAAFQQTLHDSEMTRHYSDATARIMDASALNVESSAMFTVDMRIFEAYSGMLTERADAATPEQARALDGKIATYKRLYFTPRLEAAIAWSVKQEAETGVAVLPFQSSAYVDEVYREAMQLRQEGQDLMIAGHAENVHSDNAAYVLACFSPILFLLGVCNVLKNNIQKLIIISLCVGLFVMAAAHFTQIPALSI